MAKTTRKHKKPGPKGLSTARIRQALIANGGLQASAARVLKVSRSAICQHVSEHPELRAAIALGKAEFKEVVLDQIIQAILSGDMTTVRWYADRQMRDEGFGFHVDRSDDAPIDEITRARMTEAFAYLGAEVERRIRAGEPPLFSDNQNLIEAKGKEVRTP